MLRTYRKYAHFCVFFLLLSKSRLQISIKYDKKAKCFFHDFILFSHNHPVVWVAELATDFQQVLMIPIIWGSEKTALGSSSKYCRPLSRFPFPWCCFFDIIDERLVEKMGEWEAGGVISRNHNVSFIQKLGGHFSCPAITPFSHHLMHFHAFISHHTILCYCFLIAGKSISPFNMHKITWYPICIHQTLIPKIAQSSQTFNHQKYIRGGDR